MATLTLRIDEEARSGLDRLAQVRDTTISTLLREAIDGLLGRDVDLRAPETESVAPQNLTVVERRILELQHEILKRLTSNKEDTRHHERRMQVLRQGFTSEYHQEFIGVEPEMPPADCALVMDILDMFVVLEAAVDRLGEDAEAELGAGFSRSLLFRGFDHNNPQERRLASFAKYLIDDGRWEPLAYHFDADHDHGNSHMRMLKSYQRMLETYKTIVSVREADRGGGFDAYLFDADNLRTMLNPPQTNVGLNTSRDW
ncbi:YfbU family protein [Amycolatopsis sp. TNS106]|uniref:YfbU family protein n=1 Tax=Amycolatopsis sp. TNS106 TaxID=2861750 RepID=UPI001C58C4FC|nr:YfbU family protein [Amycolatopsis sp. TNS106]QXV63561.1 hypothetical protein CVV72_41100 [Amycolatopsis sp. TNS106]